MHEDGFGIGADDDVESEAGFAQWLDKLCSGPGSLWWIVGDEVVVGGIALRAERDERAAEHGHLGYGVRPSARGRGVASWAVDRVLEHARRQGRFDLIAVCRDDNLASIHTLEGCGGRFQARFQRGDVGLRRYVIPL
nr:GNAT family N-acetyltransferase [Flexivirga oryzae]